MMWVRLALAIIVASAGGLWLHAWYGRGWTNAYVQAQAAAGRLDGVVREPYPDTAVLIAALTSLIPMALKVLLFVLMRDLLPGRSGAVKGLWFGLVLLAISDSFIRGPIMSVVVGNPVDVVLVQSAEWWVIPLAMGLIIGVVVPADAAQELRRWLQPVSR